MSTSASQTKATSDMVEKSFRKERPEKQKIPMPSFAEPATQFTFLIGPGDNPIKFLVHKEFTCYYSSVLSAAFNGSFVEGQTQTYRIEDTSPSAFRLFFQWLYSQKIDVYFLMETGRREATYGSPTPEESRALIQTENMDLVELWVLADRLAIPELQNLAVKHINAIGNLDDPATETFDYIYQNTVYDSPLRRLVVQQCAHQTDPTRLLRETTRRRKLGGCGFRCARAILK
ncbi:hypothetical protein IFR05_011457 [Cadophora sp. M221]|nr:hypothetical protein IFR05_011457 [Cadophora sp. M221]